MNKIIAITILLLLTMVNYIVAENKVSITDTSISAGETKDVSVLLVNETQYVAFQFDLYLPTGIQLVGYEVNRNRVPQSTTVSMAMQEDGNYRFLAAAKSMEPIAGNSGSIVTLKLKASTDITMGNLTGYLRNVKLSKVDATGLTIVAVPFSVEVVEPPTVTVKSYTREYGEMNPTFEYDVKGDELDGSPDISCEATPRSPVGTYPIVVTKGSVTNYNTNYVNGALTVMKAPLTVTARNHAVKQGEALPTFTATYSGFKNGETASVLTKQPTFTCTATSASAPGTYDIMVSGAEAQNYELTFVRGTLTIVNADAVVVTANDCTRQYGETNPAFEFTSTGKNLVGTPDVSCDATALSPVGTYPIVVKKGSVTNYNDSYVNGTLTITKAPMTIAAQSFTIKQGEVLPTFTATYTGFKNGETESVLSNKPVFTCAATPASELGTYDIIVNGATAQNYDISYTKGTLTIIAPDSYVLTYMVDGEIYKTYKVEFGANITAEDEPTKEGYIFSGWSGIPFTMPDKDVTVTGYFTHVSLKTSGDANGDGSVNVFDVTATVNYILGSPNDGFDFEAADVNGDGTVNVFDVTKIVNIILGVDAGAKKREE